MGQIIRVLQAYKWGKTAATKNRNNLLLSSENQYRVEITNGGKVIDNVEE